TSSTPSSRQKRKRNKNEKYDSLMDLYFHELVAHIAIFYESMDFKNSCAERGEAFLCWMKRVFGSFTNKNLEDCSATREIPIRQHYRSEVDELFEDYDALRSRISSHFAKHKFEEVC